MSIEKISKQQSISMLGLFVIGSSIVVGVGNEAKQDIWISILIAFIATIPIIFIYSKLHELYPGKDFYEISKELFGPILGTINSLLYTWYAFHLGALVIRNLTEFINVVSFPETSQKFIVIPIMLLSIWLARAGIEVMARWDTFVFPFLLLIITLTLLLSFTNADFLNLKPTLYNGLSPIFSSAFAIFSFPFGETVVFLMVFHSLKSDTRKFSVYFIGLCFGAAFLIFSALRNIMILGVENSTTIFFPSYMAVRTISIGEFLQRFEVFISINYILSGIAKISVCLYAASFIFSKIINIKNKNMLVIPLGLLMADFSLVVYGSTIEMMDWASKIYKYYAFPFQVIIPIIMIFTATIKKYRNK